MSAIPPVPSSGDPETTYEPSAPQERSERLRLLGDLAERSLWTFIQVFLSVLIGDSLLSLDVDVLQMASMSGLGAVLSLVKSFAAAQLAKTETGALAPWSTS